MVCGKIIRSILKSSITYYLLVGVFFIALAIVFTWPLITHISTAIIGRQDFTDGPFFLWNIWWIKKAILNLQNPFFTNYVYSPANVNLSLHTLTLTTGIIFLPFSKYLSLIQGLNIIQLMSMVFSSLGVVVFVNFLTEPKSPLQKFSAVIPGIIFGFSPFVFSHLIAGHYNLTMLWPIPYVLYFYYKILRSDKILNVFLFSLFFILLGYLDQQLLFFTSIILFLVTILEIMFCPKALFAKEKKIFFLISFGLIALLYLIPYGLVTLHSWDKQVGFETFNNGDANLLFSMNPLNPLFNFPKLDLVQKILGSYRENIIPLGIVGSLLSLIGLLFFPRQFFKDKIVYLVIMIVGLFLTLGPYWQVNAQATDVKLPFYYLQNLPLFDLGIVPTRFILIVYFSLAVLTGLTLVSLIEFLEKKKLRFSVIIIMMIVMIFAIYENYSGLMPIDRLTINSYLEKISREEGDFTVLPYFTNQRDGFLQTQHNKKVVTGFLGRRIHDLYNEPYKRYFLFEKFLRNEGDLIGLEKDGSKIVQTLKDYQVRYIIIDKVLQDREKLEKLKVTFLAMGLKLDFEDDNLLSLKLDH